jgi:predicted HTH domain antitoxin
MGGVMSMRLRKEEVKFIEKLAKEKKVDKSTAARELIDYGKTLWIFKEYQASRLSLENAAKELDISISEFIDLLAKFGIRSPIEYEDYLKGLEALEEVW